MHSMPPGIPGEIAVHHIRKDEGRLVLPDSLCPVLDGDLQRALQEVDQLYGAVQMGWKGDVLGEGAAEFVLFVFIKGLHERLLPGVVAMCYPVPYAALCHFFEVCNL